jgi:hypothetical protein
MRGERTMIFVRPRSAGTRWTTRKMSISCSVPIERLQGREAEIVAGIRRTTTLIERMVPR